MVFVVIFNWKVCKTWDIKALVIQRLKQFSFLTRNKMKSCVLRLVWRKISFKAIDSISGESLCFFVSGWKGYQLHVSDFMWARNNATHFRWKIERNSCHKTVYCFTVQLLHYIVFLDIRSVTILFMFGIKYWEWLCTMQARNKNKVIVSLLFSYFNKPLYVAIYLSPSIVRCTDIP